MRIDYLLDKSQKLKINFSKNNTNYQAMKTLNIITKKLTLITGIAMGVLIMTTTLVNAEPTDKDKAAEAKVAAVEAEVLAQLEEEENLLAEFKAINLPTIKIFDSNDELIYEVTVDNIEDIKDKKVISLIHQSDFLMSFENTSYYKLHK